MAPHAQRPRRFAPNSVENLKDNTLADGLFHALTWVAVALGLWLLWQRQREGWSWAASGRAFVGWMLVGWGVFNLVEGLVDHHLLGIHHVRDDVGDQLPWDVAFLAFGALLVAGGLLLVQTAQRARLGSRPR